jgi:hypothetical protein
MNKQLFLAALLLESVIPQLVMMTYPSVQNIKITSVTYSKGCIVISGTLNMYYNSTIYPNVPNEFFYFNQYWQKQVGRSYYGVTLVAINWTLLQHTPTHDKLSFTITLN